MDKLSQRNHKLATNQLFRGKIEDGWATFDCRLKNHLIEVSYILYHDNSVNFYFHGYVVSVPAPTLESIFLDGNKPDRYLTIKGLPQIKRYEKKTDNDIDGTLIIKGSYDFYSTDKNEAVSHTAVLIPLPRDDFKVTSVFFNETDTGRLGEDSDFLKKITYNGDYDYKFIFRDNYKQVEISYKESRVQIDLFFNLKDTSYELHDRLERYVHYKVTHAVFYTSQPEMKYEDDYVQGTLLELDKNNNIHINNIAFKRALRMDKKPMIIEHYAHRQISADEFFECRVMHNHANQIKGIYFDTYEKLYWVFFKSFYLKFEDLIQRNFQLTDEDIQLIRGVYPIHQGGEFDTIESYEKLEYKYVKILEDNKLILTFNNDFTYSVVPFENKETNRWEIGVKKAVGFNIWPYSTHNCIKQVLKVDDRTSYYCVSEDTYWFMSDDPFFFGYSDEFLKRPIKEIFITAPLVKFENEFYEDEKIKLIFTCQDIDHICIMTLYNVYMFKRSVIRQSSYDIPGKNIKHQFVFLDKNADYTDPDIYKKIPSCMFNNYCNYKFKGDISTRKEKDEENESHLVRNNKKNKLNRADKNKLDEIQSPLINIEDSKKDNAFNYIDQPKDISDDNEIINSSIKNKPSYWLTFLTVAILFLTFLLTVLIVIKINTNSTKGPEIIENVLVQNLKKNASIKSIEFPKDNSKINSSSTLSVDNKSAFSTTSATSNIDNMKLNKEVNLTKTTNSEKIEEKEESFKKKEEDLF